MARRKSGGGDPRNLPLPGSRGKGRGLSPYLLMLTRADDSSGPGPGRRAVYESGLSSTEAFRSRLLGWLADQSIPPDECVVGEATGFPVLSIQCTARVARLIGSMPGVEDVIADTG